MGTPVVDMREVPGGLFTIEHWCKIAVDLLEALIAVDLLEDPKKHDLTGWKSKIKPQTRQWAVEYLEWVKIEERRARERALAKLTYDDKIALGLPT